MAQPNFSRRTMDIGFLSALVLAAVAFLMAGWYLSRFADSAQGITTMVVGVAQGGKPISAVGLELMQNSLGIHAYIARVLLVSCGMFVALAFGFLGFALFLVGAASTSDIAAEGVGGFKVSAFSLAPGTVALIAASVLAGICVTRPLPVNFSMGATPSTTEAPAGVSCENLDPLCKADMGPSTKK